MRCSACNHVSDVALVPASIGKWTVVDPDGVTRQFSSWQELMASLPLSGTTPSLDRPGSSRVTRSSSAAALLDVTPAPAQVSSDAAVTSPSGRPVARLSLVPADDPPPLPRNRVPRIEIPSESETEELVDEADIMPASDDGRARRASEAAMRAAAASAVAANDAADVEPEIVAVALAMPSPVPRSGVVQPPPLPAAASVRPPSSSPALPPPLPPAPSSSPSLSPPPPAPKGGTLKTLPPPPRHHAPAPPPPTIDVESDPVVPAAAKSNPSPSPSESSSAPTLPPRRPSRELPRPTRPAPAPMQRPWLAPAFALGLLACAIAYVMQEPPTTSPASAKAADPVAASPAVVADPPSPSVPTAAAVAPTVAIGIGTATVPAPAATTAAAAAPTIGPAPAPISAINVDSLPSAPAAPAAPVAAHGSSKTTGAAVAGEPGATKSVGDLQLTLPEVLERAAQARKSGDAAHAKALLLRALQLSPGNAEAHGLLGDLARSQGDLAGAKASYEKALATSAAYFPAQLGLADTQWDLGERDAAQRRYAALFASSRSTPDRVKERAQSAAPAAPPAAPAAPPASQP
jgi:hypothetical protein